MSFVQTDDAGRRLWQGIGGLIFGDKAASDVDFVVTSRDGQISLDARPAVPPPSPVVATVGGFQVTFPMLLIAGAIVAYLAMRK